MRIVCMLLDECNWMEYNWQNFNLQAETFNLYLKILVVTYNIAIK